MLPSVKEGIALRPYQIGALDRLRSEFRSGKKRVLLYSPTGSGKTEIAMEMMRCAKAKGRGVLFICNRIELVGQASRRLFAAGISHGIIQGSATSRTYESTIVASIQTIASRGFPPNVGLVIVDEAHGAAGSKAYQEFFKANAQVPVIGLSATPFSRGMGKHYAELGGALFESIVAASTIRELVELGFLVDCEIFSPSEPDLTGVKIVAGDYNEKQLGVAVDKPSLVGDIVHHWRKLGNDKQTVVFATNIAHSQHICEEFNRAGISAEHIDCYTEEVDRRGILNRLSNGSTRVVCNVSVLAEGWDCPSVEVMVLARPTRSLTRYIQMAGRVLRPFNGKAKAVILDHSGSAKRLGYPTDDLPLELDDGKPNKSGERKKDDDKALPECGQCKVLLRRGECPACGFKPKKRNTVATIDGVLTKLERKQPTIADKQKFYSELLSIQQERGKKRNWVLAHYRAKFKSWPDGLREFQTEPSIETRGWVTSRAIAFAKAQQKVAA